LSIMKLCSGFQEFPIHTEGGGQLSRHPVRRTRRIELGILGPTSLPCADVEMIRKKRLTPNVAPSRDVVLGSCSTTPAVLLSPRFY